MDTELEQVSRCLEQALIAFSAGQSDDGCRHLQQATAILNNVNVAVTAETSVDMRAAETVLPDAEATPDFVMAAAA